ncbi:hypothetical protein J1605_006467 [Eschrichtius robustus]|uniref:Secreted protein n=1 Tax=Eschrichtius robustus TaxID=9764 RepID=A0AB34H4X5_ESCRO|nr:hypothetical protein J1605_006467 [Eschrichtius robustus]
MCVPGQLGLCHGGFICMVAPSPMVSSSQSATPTVPPVTLPRALLLEAVPIGAARHLVSVLLRGVHVRLSRVVWPLAPMFSQSPAT